jgi:hypothetical protein
MTNRHFNLNKFRVLVKRLTDKSTTGHSGLPGGVASCRQAGQNSGMAWKPIKRVSIDILIEKEAPK